MKLTISSIQPDALSVKFDDVFVFDTWYELSEFIEEVYRIYHGGIQS